MPDSVPDYARGPGNAGGAVSGNGPNGEPDQAPRDAARRPGAAAGPPERARLRLARGSAAEHRRLIEFEALAAAVGGRLGSHERWPEPRSLRRIEARAQLFSDPHRSRFVQKDDAMPKRKLPVIVPEAEGPTPHRAAADGPTAERLNRGDVERIATPIAGAPGAPARPYRAVDTLAAMERRGTITAGMRQAGEDFRARFTRAQLHPLRALDLAQLRGVDRSLRAEPDQPGLRIETARRSVWQSIGAVGGIGSPAGSCLWHVIGWERSLKEWAIEQGWNGRRVSPEAAAGILIAALGALEQHYGTG